MQAPKPVSVHHDPTNSKLSHTHHIYSFRMRQKHLILTGACYLDTILE